MDRPEERSRWLGIPPWLSKPVATLPAKGRIGLQGKHGDATVWFRNVRLSPAL